MRVAGGSRFSQNTSLSSGIHLSLEGTVTGSGWGAEKKRRERLCRTAERGHPHSAVPPASPYLLGRDWTSNVSQTNLSW